MTIAGNYSHNPPSKVITQAKAFIGNSYTLLWSNDWCEEMRRYGQNGQPLTVLFGGPHQSEPRFHRFGVRAGDCIYVVRVPQGVLRIVGRLRVGRIWPLEEYVSTHSEIFGNDGSDDASATFARWRDAHPEKQYLFPTCTDEVATGEGTATGLDIVVPSNTLESLRFCSQKGERALKHLVEGRLKSVVSLQGGTYRLSKPSAQAFEELLVGNL